MAALKNNSHLCHLRHFRIANSDHTADESAKGGLDRDLRKVTRLQVARLADRQSHLDASTLSYEPWSSSSPVVSLFIDLFSEVGMEQTRTGKVGWGGRRGDVRRRT